MAIHHELSSDIAVALLTGRQNDPDKLRVLKEVVFKVHKALQQMKIDASPNRRLRKAVGETRPERNKS